MRIGGACCVRGTAPGAIPLAVWCPEGAWGGFASLIVVDWPCSSHEQGLCCRDEASAAASADGERDGSMTDLPLVKAAKLWAKVSARTGAAYLTGRWGGCRVLVFENLERRAEAGPSHFLFLGEAGEWPVPDQAATPVTAPGPVQEVAELQAVPAAPVEDGAGEKPVRRRRKARGKEPTAGPVRKARKRREGWNGSVYRRPSKEAVVPAEAEDAPFTEDPLDDIGRT